MNTSASNPNAIEVSSSPVRVACHDGLCEIILNRPESRNALGADMVDELTAAVAHASTDAETRVILITAAGEVFSAGGNLSNMTERLVAQPEAGGLDPIAMSNRRYGKFLELFSACPKPTVVAVRGAAMGGGAGLVCAADIAIGMEGAKFGFPETTIGLVPAQILPFVAARVGVQHARRLMLTGERIGAQEALRIGMIDYFVDDPQTLQDRVASITAMIAGCGPVALARTKLMLRTMFNMESWQVEGLPCYLDAASQLFAQQMRTEAIEGVAASRAKRRPNWNPNRPTGISAKTL